MNVVQKQHSFGTIEARRSGGPGLTGLRNIGNTCFLNSIVQCLSNTTLLRDYILAKQYQKDIRSESRGDLVRSFADLLQDIWNNDQPVANTTLFKAQVQRFAPRFMGYNQQDAQEFLRYLLEGLHHDVNQVTTKLRRPLPEISDDLPDAQKALESWRQYVSYENSSIVDLFVGQLKSTLTFAGCGHRSTTFEVFWDISLPLPSRLSAGAQQLQLAQCLDHFMQDETLDGDNMAACARCRVRRPCTKRYWIHKFPRVLVLHLKRFSPTERFRKLSAAVSFPVEGLDLRPYCETAVNRQVSTYDLYAVSNHSGTAQSGHYTAICKNPNTQMWYLFNDSVVSGISPSRIASPQAYVLFYEQRQLNRLLN